MTDPTRSVRDQIAEAARTHEPEYHSGYLTGEPDYFTCTGCGWRSDDDLDDIAQQFTLHVADAMLALPVIADALAYWASPRGVVRACPGDDCSRPDHPEEGCPCFCHDGQRVHVESALRAERDALRATVDRVRALRWEPGNHQFVPTDDLRRALDDATQAAPHDCATCTDCIHDGNECCGCYDGACCHAADGATQAAAQGVPLTEDPQR